MQQQSAARSVAVLDPRTGRRDFDLAVADRAAVAASAARLRQGQKAWAAMDIDARMAVLTRWGELVAGPFRQADRKSVV